MKLSLTASFCDLKCNFVSCCTLKFPYGESIGAENLSLTFSITRIECLFQFRISLLNMTLCTVEDIFNADTARLRQDLVCVSHSREERQRDEVNGLN